MSRLEQLYQEMILEHNKSPRNFRELEPCTHSAHGVNPLCGDDYHVYANVEEGVLTDLTFHGDGCAISKSSGSLLTSALKGKTVEEAETLKNHFLALLIDNQAAHDSLGKLKVFEGVKKYPIRVKCATLVWRALEAALQGQSNNVSTE